MKTCCDHSNFYLSKAQNVKEMQCRLCGKMQRVVASMLPQLKPLMEEIWKLVGQDVKKTDLLKDRFFYAEDKNQWEKYVCFFNMRTFLLYPIDDLPALKGKDVEIQVRPNGNTGAPSENIEAGSNAQT